MLTTRALISNAALFQISVSEIVYLRQVFFMVDNIKLA